MKINKREKLFIFVLLILIIIFIVDKLMPIITSKRTSISENYNKTKEIYDSMSQNIRMKNFYEKEKEKLLAEVSELNSFSDIKQENIIEILYNSLSTCGIEIISINFSNIFTTSIDILSNETVSESKMDNVNNEMNQLPVKSMIINIEFKSSYEKILALIDKLQENNCDIAITNIHITKFNFNDNYCVMDVIFYAIPLNINKRADEV